MQRPRHTKKPRHFAEDPTPKGDFAALMDHVREHPWQYAVASGFILICVVVGLMYRVSAEAANKEVATGLIRALDQSEVSAQIVELEQLEKHRAGLQPDVVYMLGEKAFAERDYEKARAAFDRVRNDFAKSAVAADAVEGLGAILEDQKDYKGAITLYEEVLSKFPDSFAALRQPLNIGRCKERMGDLEGARASYQEQVDTFPGSMVAADAQIRLDEVSKQMAKAETAAPSAAAEADATTPAQPGAPGESSPSLSGEGPALEPAPDAQDGAAPSPEAADDVSAADAPGADLQLQLPTEEAVDAAQPVGTEDAAVDRQLKLPDARE